MCFIFSALTVLRISRTSMHLCEGIVYSIAIQYCPLVKFMGVACCQLNGQESIQSTHCQSIVIVHPQQCQAAVSQLRMSGDAGEAREDRAMGSSGSASSSFSHIESLLRAIHQPMVNVSRPDTVLPLQLVLGNIEEQPEESSPVMQPKRPLFDIESQPPSPTPPAASIFEAGAVMVEGDDCKSAASKRNLAENLERFNKNVLNVMDSLMKSRADSPMPSLTSSESTGKPFAFYHRMQRHNSAHSLNIPNIVVTGSESQQQPNHPHKRFSFGLRRHSHAVGVGSDGDCGGVWLALVTFNSSE